MMQLVRIPHNLLPAYRERQKRRLLRNLRISLPAGGVISLAFLPWSRMHDPTNSLPTTELGVFLAAGLFLILGITFIQRLQPWIELQTMVGCLFTLTMVSTTLAVLPDGFLYGVGALLSFTVVTAVLAIDLSVTFTSIVAVFYFTVPNAALLITDASTLTILNTNWILIPGGLIAFGLAFVMDQSHRNEFLLETELAIERDRGDALLSAMLPARIVRRLQASEEIIADVRPDATVLFADLVGFTKLSRTVSPEELIDLLTRIFTSFDELARDHGLEKIKTIGDSYMVAAGVADAQNKSCDSVAEFGLEAIEAIRLFYDNRGNQLDIRVGMATGEVICGVIGRRKPYFDLWGTTVNLASRLQSTAPPGAIHVDEQTAKRLSERYSFAERGTVALAGLGEVSTCLLLGRLDQAHAVVKRDRIEPAFADNVPTIRSVSTAT